MQQPHFGQGLYAWFIVSLFYSFQYILRVMPSIMMPDLLTQFHIDEGFFGQFSGVYYIGYALAHIPLGLLLDKYGPRRILTLCSLLTVVGLSPILCCDHWALALLGRFLIGIGSSGAILGCFKIIRLVFAEAKFARMLSFSVMIGLTGAIYGGAPVTYLCTVFGYQWVTLSFMITGLLISMLTFVSLPSTPLRSGPPLGNALIPVLTHRLVLLTCIFAGLMVGPLEGFADVWGVPFLKSTYALTGLQASSLCSLIFLGMCFGSPLLSLMAEKIQNTLLCITLSGAIMALVFLLLITQLLSPTLMPVFFALVGVCSAYQILSITQAASFVPSTHAGVTTAVANMIIMLFGYGFHSLIGLTVNHTHQASSGILIIIAGLVLGSLGFLGLALTCRAGHNRSTFSSSLNNQTKKLAK
jgi:predicted MFS family arabinose efflux permease